VSERRVAAAVSRQRRTRRHLVRLTSVVGAATQPSVDGHGWYHVAACRQSRSRYVAAPPSRKEVNDQTNHSLLQPRL